MTTVAGGPEPVTTLQVSRWSALRARLSGKEAQAREVLQLPHIAKGLATRLGQCMIAVLVVATAAFLRFNGKDHLPQAMVSMGGAVITGVTLMAGRYAQTCALLRPMRSPLEPAAAPTTTAPRGAEPATTIVVHCCHCHHGDASTAGQHTTTGSDAHTV